MVLPRDYLLIIIGPLKAIRRLRYLESAFLPPVILMVTDILMSLSELIFLITDKVMKAKFLFITVRQSDLIPPVNWRLEINQANAFLGL